MALGIWYRGVCNSLLMPTFHRSGDKGEPWRCWILWRRPGWLAHGLQFDTSTSTYGVFVAKISTVPLLQWTQQEWSLSLLVQSHSLPKSSNGIKPYTNQLLRRCVGEMLRYAKKHNLMGYSKDKNTRCKLTNSLKQSIRLSLSRIASFYSNLSPSTIVWISV